MKTIGLIFCGLSALSAAQSHQSLIARLQTAEIFESPYLSITIVPGWTATPSADQRVRVTHGRYVLSINPIFTHASGVICGRFPELAGGMPSVEAVMANVDQPAGGFECSQSSSKPAIINREIALSNL